MKTAVYRELSAVRERIAAFTEQCEAEECTDTEEAWKVIEAAYNAIDHALTPTKERRPGQEALALN